MNGRRPTKGEQIYIAAVLRSQGCIACSRLGYDNDWPEPAEYVEIHHIDGSKAPLCHYKTIPLCPVHHRGATGGTKLPKGEPVRHSPLGSHYAAFKDKVGGDMDLLRLCWEGLPLDAQDQIGEITGIWSFDELLTQDAKNKNG
ncbi:Ref family recombination enhancement nuclease [Vibrio splendidus]